MLKSRPLTSAGTSTATKEAPSILPSLGASGAIYAAVTYTALAFPETSISLLFPPTPPFPIQMGVGGFVLLDIIGAIRGWRLVPFFDKTRQNESRTGRVLTNFFRMFDHWAHLGGAAFGLWYYHYGSQLWDFFRIANLRTIPKSIQKEE